MCFFGFLLDVVFGGFVRGMKMSKGLRDQWGKALPHSELRNNP